MLCEVYKIAPINSALQDQILQVKAEKYLILTKTFRVDNLFLTNFSANNALCLETHSQVFDLHS